MGSHPSSNIANSVFATLIAPEFEHVIKYKKCCFAFFSSLVWKSMEHLLSLLPIQFFVLSKLIYNL